ncbi:MAG: nicotinamide-nucleotide amidase [Zoogloeaceae bacterium]|nr:nicotinamide-nucleotide amidase [Rhodocyclaceae bacterium]MCP5232192.1 nicotinamide-nucleotide amidase [Zoogloeaceae bacterium]MCP5240589.1 nicotinamide-nucleotide amidase [Zoogloeaceae bacterium]MCP5253298.1 nicotinamide-nucleotide amidase [Zoogloeaceae bacterium]MCP5293557.1 nicotinamide-nucleotide amidase [Zoogloeaceae bacterium]
MDAELAELSFQTGEFLRNRGWRLATAESCTGGWVAEVVTATAGSSSWFDRGFITYSDDAKRELLGVDPAVLRNSGAVSEATVKEMVTGALERSCAEVAVAISGIAGPSGGSEEKPVGTVCFAWGRKDSPAQAATQRFTGDREAVRRQAVIHALKTLARIYV